MKNFAVSGIKYDSIDRSVPAPSNKVFGFKQSPMRTEALSDLSLMHGNLFDIWDKCGDEHGLDYTSPSGNSVYFDGKFDPECLKKIDIYFKGQGNRIVLHAPKNIGRLEIACISGSSVVMGSPNLIVAMSVVCTEGAYVNVGKDGMTSRDVLIYSSKAHGLYNVADGARRFKNGVDIGDRVWLGQGSRILTGTNVGRSSVIGAYSVLAGKVPNNCAAAGNPCRVTTKDIFWVGKPVKDDGNYFEMLEQTMKPMPDFVRLTDAAK